MIGLILAPALSENQFHPVVGDTRFQAGLGSHCAELCGKFALIGGDNFRTAMSDDGPRHALLSAPRQLRANRCMPDKTLSALTNERAGQGCSVADVNLRVFQRRSAIMDEDEIWHVENARVPGAHPVADGGRQNRVLDRERLKCNAANLLGHAFLDEMSIFDLAAFQCSPCLLRRMHWARRAFFQAPGVVRMRMGEHDRVGMQPFKFPEPIETAINHHAGATIRHQQGAVHAMPPRSCVDFATRAEKCEPHPSVMRSIRAIKVKRMGAPEGPRPRTLSRAPRVQISKKEPDARELAILFTNEGIFYAKGKFSISSATGRTRCGERAADHAVSLRWQIFDYGTGTCAQAARDDRNLRPRRREGRADRCHSVYHTERVEGCFALSTFR